jgi:hypothetical protein
VLYLGIVVLAVGVFYLAAFNWEDMRSWARIAAVGVPLLLALLSGAAMVRSDDAALRRGGQAAWALAVALGGGSVAVVFDEHDLWGGLGHGGLLAVGVSTASLALLLWVLSPRHLQVLALGGAAMFLAVTIGNWPEDFDFSLLGIAALAFGGAALALTEAGFVVPRASARPVFAAVALFGPYLAGVNGATWAELVVFAAAAAIGALSVWRASFTYIAIAVVAVFFELVSFVIRHFESRVGVPVALILSGGLLVAAVLILVRLRPFDHFRRRA